MVSSLYVQWTNEVNAVQQLIEKATRQHTKDHNSRLVLRTVYENDAISRADLARITGLTKTTVSEVVSGLMDRGLIEETGLGPSAGGRAPVLLQMTERNRHLLGLSLSTGAARGGLISLRGEIRSRSNQTLARPNGEEALAAAYAVLDELVAQATTPLIGIGVSTPGLIDTTSGVVRRAVHFGWHDFALGATLQARYGLPVYVANDSHTSALAAYMFGGSQSRGNLVALRVGQGIGAGIVLGGQLFYGDSFGAGEIGHVAVVDDGLPCKCGNRGCLETVASVPAILARAYEATLHHPGSLLAANNEQLDLAMLAKACHAGDATALAVVAEAGRYLGAAVANLIGSLNIRRVLISGRAAVLGEYLGQPTREAAHRRVLPILAAETEIIVAPPSPDNQLLGASALLLSYELGI
jgi:N-acetylglucosamine repressor